MKGPLCKVCGKPVPKIGSYVAFGGSTGSFANSRREERPRSREEVARVVNGSILSVSWHYAEDDLGRWISSAHVWDGVSYAHRGHFHAESCAAAFGRAMADTFPDYAMPDYREAMVLRATKAKLPAKPG